MATLKEILSLETETSMRIYLKKEGVFWKCYDRSAFRVSKLRPAYTVRKRFYVTVDREMVSVGFPIDSVYDLFDGYPQLDPSSGLHYVDSEVVVRTDEFERWMCHIPLDPPQVRRKNPRDEYPKAVVPPPVVVDSPKQDPPPVQQPDAELRALITQFDLNVETPLSCMNFIQQLKRKVESGELNSKL